MKAKIASISVVFSIILLLGVSQQQANSQSQETITVLEIGGKYYPIDQFISAEPDICPYPHYHGAGFSATSLDGHTIYDESECGFGPIAGTPVLQVYFKSDGTVGVVGDYPVIHVGASTTTHPTIQTRTGYAQVLDNDCVEFTGTGIPGDTVTVFVNEGGVFNFNSVGNIDTVVDENGNWSVVFEPCLEDGYYDIGISYSNSSGIKHDKEFPIIIDTGSGVSIEIKDKEAGYLNSDDSSSTAVTPEASVTYTSINPGDKVYLLGICATTKIDGIGDGHVNIVLIDAQTGEMHSRGLYGDGFGTGAEATPLQEAGESFSDGGTQQATGESSGSVTASQNPLGDSANTATSGSTSILNGKGAVQNDGGLAGKTCLFVYVDEETYNKAVNYINEFPREYRFFSQNCVDFAENVFEETGVDVPATAFSVNMFSDPSITDYTSVWGVSAPGFLLTELETLIRHFPEQDGALVGTGEDLAPIIQEHLDQFGDEHRGDRLTDDKPWETILEDQRLEELENQQSQNTTQQTDQQVVLGPENALNGFDGELAGGTIKQVDATPNGDGIKFDYTLDTTTAVATLDLPKTLIDSPEGKFNVSTGGAFTTIQADTDSEGLWALSIPITNAESSFQVYGYLLPEFSTSILDRQSFIYDGGTVVVTKECDFKKIFEDENVVPDGEWRMEDGSVGYVYKNTVTGTKYYFDSEPCHLIKTVEDDGDDPSDTPQPIIYGEEIDPNATYCGADFTEEFLNGMKGVWDRTQDIPEGDKGIIDGTVFIWNNGVNMDLQGSQTAKDDNGNPMPNCPTENICDFGQGAGLNTIEICNSCIVSHVTNDMLIGMIASSIDIPTPQMAAIGQGHNVMTYHAFEPLASTRAYAVGHMLHEAFEQNGTDSMDATEMCNYITNTSFWNTITNEYPGLKECKLQPDHCTSHTLKSFNDGNWKLSDGTVLSPPSQPVTSDGDPVTTSEDGKTITTYPDGSKKTVYPNGNVTFETPDGKKVTVYPDDTLETKYPDGTTITEYPDGTTETVKPDGTTVTESDDGIIETELPDGTLITEFPDGRTVTQNPDETIADDTPKSNDDGTPSYDRTVTRDPPPDDDGDDPRDTPPPDDPPGPKADLRTTVARTTPYIVQPGGASSFLVKYSNLGPDPAENAAMSIILRDAFFMGPATISNSNIVSNIPVNPNGVGPNSCITGPTFINCNITTFDPTTFVDITVDLGIVRTASSGNVVTVSSNISAQKPVDPNLANNNDSKSILIKFGGPIEVTKIDHDINEENLIPGDILQYEIIVSNNDEENSTVDYKGLNELEDPIPANTSYVANSIYINDVLNNDNIRDGIGFDSPNNKIIWNGSIPPEEKLNVKFKVKVNDRVSDSIISNQAVFDQKTIQEPSDDPDTTPDDDPTVSKITVYFPKQMDDVVKYFSHSQNNVLIKSTNNVPASLINSGGLSKSNISNEVVDIITLDNWASVVKYKQIPTSEINKFSEDTLSKLLEIFKRFQLN